MVFISHILGVTRQRLLCWIFVYIDVNIWLVGMYIPLVSPLVKRILHSGVMNKTERQRRIYAITLIEVLPIHYGTKYEQTTAS